MRPQAELLFTHSIVYNRRNGKRLLQFRLANLRGFPIVGIGITAHLGRRVISEEGESYVHFDMLTFTCPGIVLAPIICTHTIDENSPLFNQSLAVDRFINILVTGYDMVLSENVAGLFRCVGGKETKKKREM